MAFDDFVSAYRLDTDMTKEEAEAIIALVREAVFSDPYQGWFPDLRIAEQALRDLAEKGEEK